MEDLDRKLIEDICMLTPEQKKEVDTVLTKYLSGEPITDQERKENPEMWAYAEKFFKFGKA
jgi:hypothetical protein